ncbi:ferritin-like domain-containing protein [Isosphaeraceae bacterium EP7]
MLNELDREVSSTSEVVDEPAAGRGRRSFLMRSTLAIPAALAMSGVAKAGSLGTLPSLYSGWNSRNFREIGNDEANHVSVLTSLLGANARPKPTFQNLVAGSAAQFAGLSQAFENIGVGAYLRANFFIFDAQTRFIANQIALAEAYHAGYLNTLVNTPVLPNGNSFANGLLVSQVVNAVSPYVASLNGGPAPGYDDVSSAANDINILNFALLLEQLEAEFYSINIPRVFG